MLIALALLAVVTAAPPEIVVPRIGAPVIDGSLDDPAWRDALVIGDFTLAGKNQPPTKPVEARVGFDEESLYLGFRCAEPHPDRLRALATPGSADVWRDDCIEVWLRTDGEGIDFDQFIVNARGVTQSVRQRRRAGGPPAPVTWRAAAHVGPDAWTAELAIPYATLEAPVPHRGERYGLKLGREDHTSEEPVLSTWPAATAYGGVNDYGGIYFEAVNLLRNAALTERTPDGYAGWSFSEENRDAVHHEPTAGDPSGFVMRTQGRYMAMNQSLRLRPFRTYELSARLSGTAGCYLRGRVNPQPGGASVPFTVEYRPADGETNRAVRFATGPDGQVLVVIGSTESDGRGEVRVRDLTLRQVAGGETTGPAITVSDAPLVLSKLLVTDCRFSRGFCGTAVDGTTASLGWNATPWEYGHGHAGAGVGYGWKNNEGVHITFADDRGFDWLVVRGGVSAKLYGPGAAYDEPAEAPLLAELKGAARRTRARLEPRAKVDRVSLFDIRDGLLADVQFYRLGSDLAPFTDLLPVSFGARATDAIARRMAAQYPEDARQVVEPGPLRLSADRTLHLISASLAEDTPTTGLRLRCVLRNAPRPLPLQVVVHDPVDPRLVLIDVDLDLTGDRCDVVLDYPDQIWPAGTSLWLTLVSAADAELADAEIAVCRTTRDAAVPEALAYRKLLMRTFFSAASEARQWGTIRRDTDLAEWARTNQWGDQVMQVFETIAHATWLEPTDDLVRQYREWVHRSTAPVELTATVPEIPGAPEWAVLAREAWLLSRSVAEWWLDHRLVPNGELGGLVGDDSDMYQNFADLPLFESDGVGARVVDAGTRLAELALATTLEGGLNRHTTDPLHAYEEGINQLTLMTLWHYGDPYWQERCLESARNTIALTTINPRGHRFFKSQNVGAEDLRIDRPTDVDGHAHPLMWHTALEALWYADRPQLLTAVDEWARAWLAYQGPEEYATAIEVATEKVTAAEKDAFRGGYGSQASAFISLFQITGNQGYLAPLLEEWRAKGRSREGRSRLPEFAELLPEGALAPEQRTEHHISRYRATGDRSALCDALRRDIGELQRFWAMYTSAEVFTDRVFLYSLINPALCYLGGSWTRNNYSRDHAVSWSGFGTDYAALVATNRREALKVLLYNLADRELAGQARLWRLEHGQFRLRYGLDRDGDDQIDELLREETLTLGRGSRLDLTLPARETAVLELTLLEGLDDLRLRPDLAISERELTRDGNRLRVLVHNLGAAASDPTDVVLVDPAGQVLSRAPLPALGPADLSSTVATVELTWPPASPAGCRVVVDPEDVVAEIDEDNNHAPCG